SAAFVGVCARQSLGAAHPAVRAHPIVTGERSGYRDRGYFGGFGMPTDTIKNLEELEDWVPRFLGINTGGGVFGLQGDLGVGKTTFVRSVVGHLAALNAVPVPRVISPTYVLHQLYEIGPATVDHFD